MKPKYQKYILDWNTMFIRNQFQGNVIQKAWFPIFVYERFVYYTTVEPVYNDHL